MSIRSDQTAAKSFTAVMVAAVVLGAAANAGAWIRTMGGGSSYLGDVFGDPTRTFTPVCKLESSFWVCPYLSDSSAYGGQATAIYVDSRTNAAFENPNPSIVWARAVAQSYDGLHAGTGGQAQRQVAAGSWVDLPVPVWGNGWSPYDYYWIEAGGAWVQGIAVQSDPSLIGSIPWPPTGP